VSKKKTAAALFEVIQETKESRRAPGTDVPVLTPVRQEQPAPDSRENDPLARALPRPTGIANGKFGPPKKPSVYRAGGRLNLSLSWATGTVAAIGMLTAIVFAFLLGRWAIRSAPAEQAGQPAPRQQDKGKAVEAGNEQRGLRQEPASVAREGGKYYLVIQNLGVGYDSNGQMTAEGRSLQKEAEHIAKDLKAMGRGATVNTWKGKYIIVWSVDGFDSPRSQEATKFAKDTESLGNGYLANGHRWSFRQRNAQGTFDPMFIPEPKRQ